MLLISVFFFVSLFLSLFNVNIFLHVITLKVHRSVTTIIFSSYIKQLY